MDNLTVEQLFSIEKFKHLVKNMSREQAQELLIKIYSDFMVRENYYKELIAVHWGLENND
jgi:uncharacterized protein YueI